MEGLAVSATFLMALYGSLSCAMGYEPNKTCSGFGMSTLGETMPGKRDRNGQNEFQLSDIGE